MQKDSSRNGIVPTLLRDLREYKKFYAQIVEKNKLAVPQIKRLASEISHTVRSERRKRGAYVPGRKFSQPVPRDGIPALPPAAAAAAVSGKEESKGDREGQATEARSSISDPYTLDYLVYSMQLGARCLATELPPLMDTLADRTGGTVLMGPLK